MGKTIDSPLTDEELAENGINAAVLETDEGFFKWVDDIIAEAFGEVLNEK